MRLFLAASIVAYSIRFVTEKKTKKFIICILIATTFHYSAIFMLFLVYFSSERENNERSMRSIIILVTIIMPILIYVVSQIMFPNMGDRYSNKTSLNKLSLSLGQFDKLPIVLIGFYLYKDMLKENKRYDDY